MITILKVAKNVHLGLISLRAHKLRSALTALGIVFGVASVICMLAIGEGLSYEATEQIKRLGSNNIILRSVQPPDDPQASQQMVRVLQYGLTYTDVERMTTTVPGVEAIVPHREIRTDISFRRRRLDGRVVGTVPRYLQTTSSRIVAGRFISSLDLQGSANVCVLHANAARNIGGLHVLLGTAVKLGTSVYKVIGIIEGGMPTATGEAPAAIESQNEVYIPLTSARRRFGEVLVERRSGTRSFKRVELHGAIVRVKENSDVLVTAAVIDGLLKTSHEQPDYDIVVPLQLLREKERVKRLYNIVLGLMASISLVVGGIGIMNIMLATVTERTPEIGVRRAIGARRRDILAQFLTETILLSGIGGLAGVGLGYGMAMGIRHQTEVQTIVSAWSVVMAFGISALVGIIFGFYPALRAANMDPITALRHE
ncbi:MAG: ABC transporter permease [Candidatus Brocadiia bacterium]|jgi:putative ABC transport system permease protein|nr:ABC transporter permease [Candidatus Brocadiia bacterium]